MIYVYYLEITSFLAQLMYPVNDTRKVLLRFALSKIIERLLIVTLA